MNNRSVHIDSVNITSIVPIKQETVVCICKKLESSPTKSEGTSDMVSANEKLN